MSIPRGTAAAPVAVSVTSSATLLRAANTGRKALLIVNNGAADMYVGLSDVTAASGIPVKASGGALSLTPPFLTQQAIYGRTASATIDARVWEIT
jgi:hypothetical protein